MRYLALLKSLLRGAIVLTFFVPGFAGAQESLPDDARPDPKSEIKVDAVVQYVDGSATKTEASGVQTRLVYQTAIYEGDRIETARGATLKIATRNGCLIVLRGEGLAVAPPDKKPWRMKAESLRLICTGKKEPETFGISNSRLTIKEGEVLFLSSPPDGLRILLLSGSASVQSKALELHKLYSLDASSVLEMSPQPNEMELRKTNLEQNPPRESWVWPEPERNPTFRLILGPAIGRDVVNYDYPELSQTGLKGDGPRLQAHFKTAKDQSVIVALTFREAKDESIYSQNGPTTDKATNQLQHTLLEAGIRSHHDRWWSPFWRLGLGYERVRINKFSNNFNGSYVNSDFSYEFYAVTAAYGIDAFVAPHFLKPLGFYGSLEGQVVQSFMRGGRINESPNFTSQGQPPEPWRLTSFAAIASFGIMLQY